MQRILRILRKYCAFLLIIFFIFHTNLHHILVAHATYINTIEIQGDFTIENDAINSSNRNVTLNIDLTGVSQMRFWNTPWERDLATWEAFSSTKAWTLSAWEWKKTVYASFQNGSATRVDFKDDIIVSPSLPYTTWLTLWLDAWDNDSITENSWNISRWNDKSWNNYHARQNTGWNQANLQWSEIDFNGSSDYFYLEGLNYQNSSPLDAYLVCTVFRTQNTSTSISWNWAFLDFDRSEWFNFYNRWDGIGMSYDAGGNVNDVYVSGIGINNNSRHIACWSYNNSVTNDTVVSVDGTIQYSADRQPNGQQIGTWQATRYGFVWDGSEANSENGGRNNSYYDGGIYEMVYFDTAVSASDRKDIECYLGEKWWITTSGCPAESISPIASVSYAPWITTPWNVIATLENESENITITNNGGSNTYTFTSNGSFTFSFEDAEWNTGSTTARVDWIDPNAPPITWSGALNEAPIINSYSGSSSVTLRVPAFSTDVADIDAIDSIYNIVWEYGSSSLWWNAWQNILHSEMCNPVVVASHRQAVDTEIQRAPRVRAKSGTGFEIKVDNYNSTIWSISTPIDYIVMNAWVHNYAGWLHIQAGSNTTSSVACNASNSPTPNVVNFSPNFVAPPVVLHSISTENDSSWTVSGVNGNSWNRGSEPSTSTMWTVLQRSFDSCVHGSEDVDYIAFSPWNYNLTDGSILDATRSTDSIASVTTGGNPITFSSPFSSTPQTVLVSQLWEDGWNGWYAQIHTWWSEVTSTQVFATIDEDGPGADRSHTNEVVSSIAFDKASGQFWENNILTYSISGWADSADFTIDSSNGDLDFITGKDPNTYTDSNNDGIYEVTVEVCDSHCNTGCSSQTILADVTDGTDPVIDSTSPWDNDILPGWNHQIQILYHDDGVWIDTNSDSITLQKWELWAWWSDISWTGLDLWSKVITHTGATYNTNSLEYWKYRIQFSISDTNTNSTSVSRVFYIDNPDFIVWSGSVDIGILEHGNEKFSDSISLSVHTVWAPFRILLRKNTDMQYDSESIPLWDGGKWYGYESPPYANTIHTIGNNEIIINEASTINTHGNKTVYNYEIKIWALIDNLQTWWEYIWNIDFEIQFDY